MSNGFRVCRYPFGRLFPHFLFRCHVAAVRADPVNIFDQIILFPPLLYGVKLKMDVVKINFMKYITTWTSLLPSFLCPFQKRSFNGRGAFDGRRGYVNHFMIEKSGGAGFCQFPWVPFIACGQCPSVPFVPQNIFYRRRRQCRGTIGTNDGEHAAGETFLQFRIAVFPCLGFRHFSADFFSVPNHRGNTQAAELFGFFNAGLYV